MTRLAPNPAAPAPVLPDEPFPLIAREGWPIVGAFLMVSILVTGGAHYLAGSAASIPVGLISVALSLWAIWFFRDPPRRIPGAPGLVISPADGVVCFVGPSRPPPELGFDGPTAAGMTRVSIFMNVLDVHVNRSPVDGVVAAVNYRPGEFLNASFDKASEHNERCALRLTLPDGRDIAVVQIAGLIARRIVCRAKTGDALRRGQRFGLIRFGSRVDVYLPPGTNPLVVTRQRSVAGETLLARLTEEA
jgi:phosphatidylserine decarboxylase